MIFGFSIIVISGPKNVSGIVLILSGKMKVNPLLPRNKRKHTTITVGAEKHAFTQFIFYKQFFQLSNMPMIKELAYWRLAHIRCTRQRRCLG